MSIATEISRLQGAKDALKTAIEGKGVQVPSSALIDAYPALVDEIQQGGGASLTEAYRAAQGYIDLTEWSDFISELASVEYGLSWYFEVPTPYRDRAIGDVVIYAETIGANSFRNGFVRTHITSLDVSRIKRLEGGAFAYVCSPVATLGGVLDFDSLEYIGANGLEAAFQGTGVTELRVPKLSSAGGYPYGAGSNGAPFRNVTTLKEAHVHPFAIRAGFGSSILWLVSSVENLTLSEIATDSINLEWQTSLTSASVLDVLNHLSTSVTRKTCTFGNLTIPSSDANHAAIAAKVASLTNWTISGLTI